MSAVNKRKAVPFTDVDFAVFHKMWHDNIPMRMIAARLDRGRGMLQKVADRNNFPARDQRVVEANGRRILAEEKQNVSVATIRETQSYVPLAPALGIRKFTDPRFGVSVPYIEMLHGPWTGG